MRIKYIKSCILPVDYPEAICPEVVIVGRSNAGKSSFLNQLAGGAVAKVSQKPGKTRLLNFFEAGDNYRIVDTPGYGYSQRGGDEQASWQKMLEDYLSTRGTICGLLLLVDSKREWEEEEAMLLSYTQRIGIPMALGLTKCDRLKSREVELALAKFKKQSQLVRIFPLAQNNVDTFLEVEDFLFRTWVKPNIAGGKRV